MALIPVHCPVCDSQNVVKNGKQTTGATQFRCDNPDCDRKYFQLVYVHKGRLPETKRQIIEMALNGAGIRDTSRVLGIGRNTVAREIKKSLLASSQRSGTP